jgi:hypothetical protein
LGGSGDVCVCVCVGGIVCFVDFGGEDMYLLSLIVLYLSIVHEQLPSTFLPRILSFLTFVVITHSSRGEENTSRRKHWQISKRKMKNKLMRVTTCALRLDFWKSESRLFGRSSLFLFQVLEARGWGVRSNVSSVSLARGFWDLEQIALDGRSEKGKLKRKKMAIPFCFAFR